MKNILNRFLLVTLLALPATQVLGENIVNENRANKEVSNVSQETFVDQVKFFAKANKNEIYAAGLLTYSTLAAYTGARGLDNNLEYLYKYGNTNAFTARVCLDCIPSDIVILITALISAGYALELKPEFLNKSPEFLKNIEEKIKNIKQDIVNLIKNNKKISLAALTSWSILSTYRAASTNLYWNQNQRYVIAQLGSAILSGKLAYDLATDKKEKTNLEINK